MPLGEFELIERFFRQPVAARPGRRADVALGMGDDAALLAPPADQHLVAALDTLVEGRHFPVGSGPRSIGHRALAVNLSDLAAMGAEPAWCLLALTLPDADPEFLQPFADGLLALADQQGVALVGGDTTRGPLSVSVQALGFVPPRQALRRSGGKPGDLLFVSGTPGDAAAGLQLAMANASSGAPVSGERQYLLDRFHFPEPRVALGQALRGRASACIDVSDGLAADAGKLAQSSRCRAVIEVEKLPISTPLRSFAGGAAARELALTGGDDYELCFAVSAEQAPNLAAQLADAGLQVSCIGRLETGEGVVVTADGRPTQRQPGGYDHFARA